MINVSIEVHSIQRIELEAIEAFHTGKGVAENPYPEGSTAHRIWRLQYELCEIAKERYER
jgi:hypothetical protein